MQSALELSSPPALATLLEGGRMALFLDFDGTLVEIAPAPDAIAPVAGLSDKLAQLSRRLDGRCAIVSGRAIDDIERHVGPLTVAMAGSHGADIRDAKGVAFGRPPSPIPKLAAEFMHAYAMRNGMRYEKKPHGAALHYRETPSMADAAHELVNSLAKRHGLVVQSGKCVVELITGNADKGSAVRAFMACEVFAGAKPIFIGDDLTDEAGFAACQELGGMGILVGEREGSCAQFHLPDVASVHKWLEI